MITTAIVGCEPFEGTASPDAGQDATVADAGSDAAEVLPDQGGGSDCAQAFCDDFEQSRPTAWSVKGEGLARTCGTSQLDLLENGQAPPSAMGATTSPRCALYGDSVRGAGAFRRGLPRAERSVSLRFQTSIWQAPAVTPAPVALFALGGCEPLVVAARASGAEQVVLSVITNDGEYALTGVSNTPSLRRAYFAELFFVAQRRDDIPRRRCEVEVFAVVDAQRGETVTILPREMLTAQLPRFEFAIGASTRKEDRLRVAIDEVVLDTK